jgi:leucyl aminopeptidase
MDFKILVSETRDLRNATGDALLLVVGEGTAPDALGKVLGTALADALKHGDLAYKAGRCLYLHRLAGMTTPRVVFAVAADMSTKAFRAALVAGLGVIKGGGAKHLLVASALPQPIDEARAQSLALAVEDCLYVYRHSKPSAPAASKLQRVSLVCGVAESTAAREGLQRGEAVAAGVALARECANRPANHCTPDFLAGEARRLAKDHGLSVQVLNRKQVEKLGMGCFLAVAQGSKQPLKFIVAQYRGAGKSAPPLVLVGKGITFDTGGISIKPAAEMDEMKFDMGGAASVLGTFRALAELKPKINVIGLVPTCENMPSGTATKPGDVVTSMSGQTIEVLNTDAEGRLILCDALTYAERFKPAVVVDIATLTGACVVALGHIHSGLFSADDEVAQALLEAGQQALDTAWRMPMDDEYGESLKSNFADMGNVGGREGGAITAAVFLSKFTKAYRWAHLDIAGSAWKSGSAKGGTGRPVGLLTRFILNQAQAGRDALAPKADEPAKPARKSAARTSSGQKPGAKRAAGKSVRVSPRKSA